MELSTDQTPNPDRIFELHLHRLLVAIDGSKTADLALSAAVTAARRDRATITLLVVVPDVALQGARWAAVSNAALPPSAQEDVDEEAQRLLRATVARIPDDIPVTTLIRRGKPGPEIVAAAADGNYDAILLGARGVGRVGALLGSVSAYVAHHADIDVFVAHGRHEG